MENVLGFRELWVKDLLAAWSRAHFLLLPLPLSSEKRVEEELEQSGEMATNYENLKEVKDSSAFSITIKEMSGKATDFEFDPDAHTIGDLKKVIESKLSHPVNRQRLIFMGKELRNAKIKLKDEFKDAGNSPVVVHDRY
eukprot:jgi/Bigna1/68430/fgenesh1_pg.6_\